MDEKNEALCIGIDLGTSRSSISASNGERHVVDSYVGWPVDMVARKLAKKKVFIGHEALENRSMLDRTKTSRLFGSCCGTWFHSSALIKIARIGQKSGRSLACRPKPFA